MPKPNGLSIKMSLAGPTFKTTQTSRWEDALWDAVEEARTLGITPERFKMELIQAWTESIKRDTEHIKSLFK